MNKLDKLAQKYGADKFGKHNYTPFYYDLFRDFTNMVAKVVEIGTGEGASLFMWHDFFPHADIFGADIDPNRVPPSPGYPRLKILKCDQSSEKDLHNLIDVTGTNVNLFIDDGSHDPEHQVFTCKTVMPLLGKNVVYVIEDVADPSISDQLSMYDLEITKFSKRYDDRIILVRHQDK